MAFGISQLENRNWLFKQNLTVEGDLSVEGDFSFGDASTDSLTITGTFAQTSDATTDGHVVGGAGNLAAGNDLVRFSSTGSISATSNVLSVVQSTGAGVAGSYALYVSATGTNVEGLHVDAGDVLIDEDLEVTGTVTGGTVTDGAFSVTAGAVTGVTTLGASGAITGGTVTDGAFSVTAGAVTGVTTLDMSGDLTCDGILGAGDGLAAGVFSSNGDQDTVIKTGNVTSGQITIIDGADGNIDLAPNGAGQVTISGVPILGPVFQASVTLTSAQVKALAAAPITIAPAPPAGQFHRVISATWSLNYGGSNAFTEAGQFLGIYYTNNGGTLATNGASGTGFIDQTANTILPEQPTAAGIGIVSSTVDNQPLVATHGGAEWAGNAANDNTVVVNVLYTTELL